MVTLIQAPRFVVPIGAPDHNNIHGNINRLLDRIQNVAIPNIVHYGKIVGSSFYEGYTKSLFLTPLYLRVSLALDDVSTLKVRIIAFVAAYVIVGFVISSCLILSKIQNDVGEYVELFQLNRILNERINKAHFVCFETKVDTDIIPDAITVNKLLEYFDANIPGSPNYIPLGPVDRASLQTYVNNINNRTAFLGTPPAGAAALDVFYQKLEDLARSCIYKVEKDYQDFMDEVGGIIPDAHSADEHEKRQYQKYLDVQKAKSRLAIDLAIAGAACGARYMGDTLVCYGVLFKQQAQGGLKETISQTLANLRAEIAQARIVEADPGQNTHYYAAYMEALGKILAIPGSEGVIEHLAPFSYVTKTMHLNRFCEDYNFDRILTAVKEKHKESPEFRDLMTDWIQEQAGDWNSQAYDRELPIIVQEIQDSMNVEIDNPRHYPRVELFILLLRNLTRAEAEALRRDLNEDSFENALNNVLSLQSSRDFLNDKFPAADNQMKRIVARRDWTHFLQDLHKNKELKTLALTVLDRQNAVQINAITDGVKESLRSQEKIGEINRILIDHEIPDFKVRMPINLNELRDGLKEALKRKQGRDLLAGIMGDREIPSDEVFAWMLVSNKFLNY